MFVCGKITILWFKKSLILKLHSSPGEIVKKKLMGDQKNTTWKIIITVWEASTSSSYYMNQRICISLTYN
jgi:hypothetical protein